jgi:hypothetical protein
MNTCFTVLAQKINKAESLRFQTEKLSALALNVVSQNFLGSYENLHMHAHTYTDVCKCVYVYVCVCMRACAYVHSIWINKCNNSQFNKD